MKPRSTWWKTLIGVVITLIMLFPLYWMINISFTQRRSIRAVSLYPKDFTTSNYSTMIHTQLPYLGTSLLIAFCVVIVTLIIALPASYSLSFYILREAGV